jgi:hypothetical protein
VVAGQHVARVLRGGGVEQREPVQPFDDLGSPVVEAVEPAADDEVAVADDGERVDGVVVQRAAADHAPGLRRRVPDGEAADQVATGERELAPGVEPAPRTASACTSPSVPLPSGDHRRPSQRATFAAGTPPAALKEPAAYTSSPMRASANTCPCPTSAVTPPARSSQVEPLQRPIEPVGTAPAWSNSPPAMTPSPSASRACTSPALK